MAFEKEVKNYKETRDDLMASGLALKLAGLPITADKFFSAAAQLSRCIDLLSVMDEL